jgi:hypothetical protein
MAGGECGGNSTLEVVKGVGRSVDVTSSVAEDFFLFIKSAIRVLSIL